MAKTILVSPQTQARIDRARIQTALTTAAVGSIGGPLWDVYKPGTGDGVTSPVGGTFYAGQATVYVRLVKLTAFERAVAGTQADVEYWDWTAPESELAADGSAAGLWEGRTIQSVADPSLVFRLISLDHPTGYLTGQLDQERP